VRDLCLCLSIMCVCFINYFNNMTVFCVVVRVTCYYHMCLCDNYCENVLLRIGMVTTYFNVVFVFPVC